MEVITAVVEMQMQLCILGSKRTPACLRVYTDVCLGGTQGQRSHCFSLACIVLCFHRWWEKLTLRWNGRPNWRLEPSLRKVTNTQYISVKPHLYSLLCLLLVACFFSSHRLIYNFRWILFKLKSYTSIQIHMWRWREKEPRLWRQKKRSSKCWKQGSGTWFSQFDFHSFVKNLHNRLCSYYANGLLL